MLPENQAVWVDTRGHQVPGQTAGGTPRSYIVETPYGELRRNRAHLHIRTDTQLPVDASSTDTTLSQPVTIFALGQLLIHKLELLSVPLIVYNIDYGFRPERGDVAYGHKH